MLRAVFIGTENRLNRVVAHRLSKHTDLAGCIWIPQSARWARSSAGRRAFIRNRIRKRGLLRALDEAAYYVFYRATLKNAYGTRAGDALIDEHWNDVISANAAIPSIVTPNVNGPDVVEHIATLKPDIIFTHCIHQYIGKRLRSIAPLGIFLLHVGIVPEYRGLYPPFWTLYNLDFGNFGYSLFRVSDRVDCGELFVQGRITNVDVRRDNNSSIEIKAVLASLPDVAAFISSIENGTALPIERPEAVACSHSYPGLSDYIRQRLRIRRALQKVQR
jgi:hypothetical protein